MNAFRFPLHRSFSESDERHTTREYAVGAAVIIATWCSILFSVLLGFVMAVTCGPIYALVPGCIVLGAAAFIALCVAFVKGID